MEEKLINFIKGEYLSDDNVDITPDIINRGEHT